MRTNDSSGRRLTTLVVACAIVALTLAATATPVAGHAYLSDSDPANGDRFESLPESVTLEFSGNAVQIADVTVTGPDGEDVGDDAVIDGDDDRFVRAALVQDGDASDGIYVVDWEILAEDGHTTAGSFFFSVGDEPIDRDSVLEAYADDEDGEVPVPTTAVKGALLLALVVSVGVPITAAVAIYPPLGRAGVDPAVVDRRLTRVLVAAGGVLFGAVFTLGIARSLSVGSSGVSLEAIRAFAVTAQGRVWLGQLLVAGLLTAGPSAGARGLLERRYWLSGSLAGAVVVQASVSWTSHSAVLVDRLGGAAVDFVHVTGAGLWLGGLLVLATVVPKVLRAADPADRDRLATAAIRRYSVVALAGVTLALLTGLVLATWHAPTLSHLVETMYGTALSAKGLLAIAAVGLGGLVRFVLLRWLDPDRERAVLERRLLGRGSDGRPREDGGKTPAATAADAETSASISTWITRALTLEIALLVLAVVLSGLLTSTPTAITADRDDGTDPVTLEREYDGGVVELTVVSAAVREGNRDGTAFVDEGVPVVFDVRYVSPGDGEPVKSERPVTILAHNERADAQLRFDLEPIDESGTYSTVQAFPEAGWWELRVSGSPGGTYVGEWIDVYAIPSGHEHRHEYGPLEETGVTHLLRIGAVLVGVAGSLAVVVETARFGRRQE